MNSARIDLRSDTVTCPTKAMRRAMAEAEVGDDVFGEDPTVCRLEARLAEMLGKEAALFVPSGTMSNQIAVRLHCGRGEAFLCEADCHIYRYEQAGYAQLSGVAARPVKGNAGIATAEQFAGQLLPENLHYSRTTMLCLENTHNRSGGRILPYEEVEAICRWAHEHDLATHLDGARLLNAAVASGIGAEQWSGHFDTVSLCFSKGLGAPVGSALSGTRAMIEEARRHRKVLGGGMRQAGVIASAALYALDHHVQRLAEDHATAKRLCQAIQSIPGIRVQPELVETNMVLLHIAPSLGTADEFAARLADEGLLVLAISESQIRAVTHLPITEQNIDRAAEIIRRVAAQAPSGPSQDTSRARYAG